MDEILAALESIESPGSFSTEKSTKADNFEIKVNKFGSLAFPISENQINALIDLAKPAQFGWKDQTILDEDVRKVWEISKSKVRVGKKLWDKKFTPLLDEIKNELGLPKNSKLIAELHNLLIYEPGHFFKPHQDSEKVDGMVATLVIILPTSHEGGELIIDHRGIKKNYAFKPSKIAKLSCIAFYADCYHEVKAVTSGYRVSLTFNLILEKYKGHLESLYEPDTSTRLEQALRHYFYPKTIDTDRTTPLKMAYLLDHQYTQSGLSWDSLKNIDRIRVEALLKHADNLNLEAHLVLADMKETWDCEFDYQEYRYRKRNRSYDEEDADPIPSYITDTETQFKFWLNREGKHVDYKDFSPSYQELCWTGANDDFEPYASEYLGWMGNYGNTLDRWYHRAAIVLWRKDDSYAVLFEMDKDSFIKELFLLMQSGERLKLQEMLSPVAPYWRTYAKKHKEGSNIIEIMQLALFLNDAGISKNLLTAYELSLFNIETIPLWSDLIQSYGNPWCIDVFESISHKEKPYVFPEFSTLIASALHHITSPEFVHWLLTYQLKALKTRHKSDSHNRFNLKHNATRRVNEMTDFIMAVMQSGDKDQHMNASNYLMDNPALYTPLLLVNLLITCIAKVPTSNINSWGYDKLFAYLYEAITDEQQRGLRSKDDWSINEKSKCSCAECKLLNRFLNQSDEQQKIWALTQDRRFHIESEVKALDIPVSCRTEHTGRPYKLILTKTVALYDEAEERYKAISQAITHLKDLNQSLNLCWRLADKKQGKTMELPL